MVFCDVTPTGFSNTDVVPDWVGKVCDLDRKEQGQVWEEVNNKC